MYLLFPSSVFRFRFPCSLTGSNYYSHSSPQPHDVHAHSNPTSLCLVPRQLSIVHAIESVTTPFPILPNFYLLCSHVYFPCDSVPEHHRVFILCRNSRRCVGSPMALPTFLARNALTCEISSQQPVFVVNRSYIANNINGFVIVYRLLGCSRTW
jgi:hypothetical protein